MLNSNATGMRYNDSTCLVSDADFANFKYFDSIACKLNKAIKEQIFTSETIPQELAKKYKIIDYYKKQLKIKK
jgi:hypothetical protein